jgi:UDP-N-acetylmuramate dehydrogenase
MNEPQTFTALRGTLARDVPLARYTSWRCGGPGDRVYVPADRDDLATFVRQLPQGEPLTAIGLGSNLLVRDGGIRGSVVVLHAALNALELRAGLIYAEAGVASPKVARFAATHGFAGAEFLAGIPGTVGGALAMNAGCYGGETWRFVARVEVLTRAGILDERLPAAYVTGYRSVRRIDGGAPDGIFTAAWFAFPRGDSGAARARIAELLRRRSATQPLNLPNAGSVFRNPALDHAARLIESCGLKGYAVGGAHVSERHANFIVNPQGRAKAADIESIMAHVRAVVRAQTGVDLEPEVQVVGEQA